MLDPETSGDEIALLSTAAAMVDGVYQEITDALKAGRAGEEIVALGTAAVRDGLRDVESVTRSR